MKRLMLFVVLVVCVLGAAGQSSRSKRATPVKSTVRITETTNAATTTTKNSAYAAAALSNSTLRNELTWTFGGKQQRGWYLYELLINKTLDSKHETVSDDFAATLAKWQKKRGLDADGVLNENSLMAFVSQWQSDRLQDRTPATAEQLITAPSSDFYDPERAPELRQVERNTYEAYKRMIAAAAGDRELKIGPSEQYFKIVSAFRSREYQDELRRKSPNAGSAGLAVNSPHFTGRALDLYVGGSPVDTRDANRAIQVNTPAYRWLVRNAERFGFRPYFYEPWHWEYIK
ncbi:MAG TPA: D-alanyl-D-alanine carboxypeptidase family protein [Pyrinomonadaceae bacterium]|nr:D-alanyl-D-alanine carboxypeptidase family protein [Pyrinomonadaceae bacterium]